MYFTISLTLHKASADRGVSSAGLITTVQPTAIAGDAFLVIIAAGKFQGVIIPATPIGCLIAMYLLDETGDWKTSPFNLLASSANHSMNEAA